MFPTELQLNKTKSIDTDAPFLNLHISISNGFVLSGIYDKRKEFYFGIVNFLFLDCDVPRGVYISHLIVFASVSTHLADFRAHNLTLTAKLL